MRRFTKRGLPLAIAALLSGWGAGVFAASLGPVQVLSSPGQPLVAEIEIDNISADEASTLQVKLADSESFKKAQLEPSPLLTRLRFELVKGLTPEKAIVRMTSAEAVPARYLDTLLEISWAGGRLVREYTLVMDKRVNESPTLPSPTVSSATASSPELAPNAAPIDSKASTVAVKAKQADESGGVRRVQRGDTLGEIAKQVTPAAGAVNSTMAAIYMANKAAFIGGSIHKIREGAQLTLPDRETILARNSKQALKVLAEFDDRAEPYFQRMAAAPLPSRAKAAEADASSGVIGKVKEEKAPLADEDKLKVSRSKKDGAAGEAAAGNALAEELVIKDKAIKEANDRIAALEKNIADLQRLMELKAAGTPAVADATKVEGPAKVADAAKDATTLPVDPSKEGEAKVDGEQKSAEVSNETALKPEAEVKEEGKKDGEHEESDEESDDHKKSKPWYKNGLLLGGLGGALAIGGGGAGFFFLKRRKQKLADAENHAEAPSHQAPHSENDDLLNTGAGFDDNLAAATASAEEAGAEPELETPETALQDEPLLESQPAESEMDLNFETNTAVGESLLPPELEAGDAPQPAQPNAEFLEELDDFAAQAGKASDALEQLKQAGPSESLSALDDDFDGSPASRVDAAFDAVAGEKIDDALGKIDLDLPSDLGALPNDPFGEEPASASGAESDFAAAMNSAQMPAQREDLAAWQEMETKLDLAAAYIEIGDSDSSKELLSEVMKGGDAAQIAKAKDLMSRAD
ncbi:MAG: hypothetical protein LW629_03670 [Burkholderiales bacterium]|nr:hypothetical protein [Burkholderiales bacterium]